MAVVDIGCGQGTQAIWLARRGHTVVGVDVSDEHLAAAQAAATDEPIDVHERLTFEHADLLALAPQMQQRFAVVCCHGVLMYLPRLEQAVAAVVGAARRGGLVSVLTRNQVGIAMRAGMSGDWRGALESFDATRYRNRLGLEDVRSNRPIAVRRALVACGAHTIAWYGVRLFTDHWAAVDPPEDIEILLAAEEQAGRRDPYRSLAALTHTIARVVVPTAK